MEFQKMRTQIKTTFTFLMAIVLAICSLFIPAEAKPLEKSFNVKTETSIVSAAKIAFVASPVILANRCEEITRRRFVGYSITRSAGKIPIKALNINSIDRFEPDFVPLN